MYCKYCGGQLNDESKFCPNCGKEVENQSDGLIDSCIAKSYISFKEAFKGLFYACKNMMLISIGLYILLIALGILNMLQEESFSTMHILFSIFVTILTLLMLVVFIFVPFITSKKTKSRKMDQIILIYKDKLVYENTIYNDLEKKEVKDKISSTVIYRNFVKGKEDKTCFYFLFVGDNNKKICHIIKKSDLSEKSIECLRGVVNSLNK